MGLQGSPVINFTENEKTKERSSFWVWVLAPVVVVVVFWAALVVRVTWPCPSFCSWDVVEPPTVEFELLVLVLVLEPAEPSAPLWRLVCRVTGMAAEVKSEKG
jgi:hypothetical protein